MAREATRKEATYGSQQGETPARSRQSWPGRLFYRCFWVVVYVPIKLLFRLRVEGTENLPDGPFILSAVHRSFVDTPIVGVITGKRLRFMGKESLWNSRLLGTFLTVMGGFPVERGSADRTALRAAGDVLALGEPLVMFPEGTRQHGPRLDRKLVLDGPGFRSGSCRCADRAGGTGGHPERASGGRKDPPAGQGGRNHR